MVQLQCQWLCTFKYCSKHSLDLCLQINKWWPAEGCSLQLQPPWRLRRTSSYAPVGKHFPKSKYENVKNKQIQIFIFGTKILDLFDSEHPYLESRKSLLREFTLKSDFILMATDVSAFLQCVVQDNQPNLSNLPNPYLSFLAALQFLKSNLISLSVAYNIVMPPLSHSITLSMYQWSSAILLGPSGLLPWPEHQQGSELMQRHLSCILFITPFSLHNTQIERESRAHQFLH